MALIDTFHKQATQTWCTLRKARKVNFHYGEEGLTDANLLEIRTRHSKEVQTQTFTKREESRVGADWEWWFVADNRFIGFRVQAKVIDLETATYAHLHYQTDTKTSYQSDVLIDNALYLSSSPCIPVYCLYSNWDTNGHKYKYRWNCDKVRRSVGSYGCAIVPAVVIRAMRFQRKKDVTVQPPTSVGAG